MFYLHFNRQQIRTLHSYFKALRAELVVPMFNPNNMEKMMKQMGMDMDEVPATRVTVETKDGTELVFESPELNKIEVQGQTMFQLQGEYTEQDAGPDQEDVELVMEKTGASEDDAVKALEEHDDLTDAIMSLE